MIYEHYNGEYDKQISKILGKNFNKKHPNYKLYGYIYYIAYKMENPVWSAFKDTEAVVTPDGELMPYWQVCMDYLRGTDKFLHTIVKKHKNNSAMICCVAEVYEEYRYDSNDVPYSRIQANLPCEVAINTFNIPNVKIVKTQNPKGYYQYLVTTLFDVQVCKTAQDGVVYVQDIYKEYILCSAVYYKKLDIVILGKRHNNALQYMGQRELKSYGVCENGKTIIGGFWTSQGRFIKRNDKEEMEKLLKNHNNVKRTGKDFYSEDFIY